MGSATETAASGMDLQPLLDTLAKVSLGRLLPHAEITRENELTVARIPVSRLNPADKTDVALRRFSADWLRANLKNVSVDHRFERTSGLSWHQDDGQEIPMIGIIYLTWWRKPELPELEQLMALQRQRRKTAED